VTTICGHVSVVDLRGCGMNLMTQITPTIIKKLSSLLEPFPIRIKAIHLVHPPKAIEAAFKIFYSVCHEKLKKRIYVHATFDDLNRELPDIQRHLPKEFGGNNSNLNDIIASWKKELIANRQWFLDDEQYRVKNVNAKEVENEMFGTGGSFRSLNID
jgi:CRAL/TRIO domain